MSKVDDLMQDLYDLACNGEYSMVFETQSTTDGDLWFCALLKIGPDEYTGEGASPEEAMTASLQGMRLCRAGLVSY